MTSMEEKKDTWAITTAILMLTTGIVLCFLSFFLTIEHKIDSSILWYVAQTIVYASSIFGFSAYVNYKLDKYLKQKNGL